MDLEKNLALRWLIVQQTEKWLLWPKAASIEKMCEMKSDIFVVKVWLVKMHVEHEARSWRELRHRRGRG